MKLLLLHGAAVIRSRSKLIEIKRGFSPDNIVVFEKDSIVSDILLSLQTVSMFEGERLIILENPPENFIDQMLASPAFGVASRSEPSTLVLWFDHEVDPKKFSGAQVFFFPEAKEVSVFPFLNALGERDKKAYLELDKLKAAGFESQYFLTMVFYLLRNLTYTPLNAKDFVKDKNSKMRANFSKEELPSLYQSMLEIDFKIKKGLLETPQAEFLMVAKFLNN